MSTTTASDPKGPALADEIEYSVTITADHRLLVNDAPVGNPAIRDGDSEALLSWALVTIAQKHDEIGGSLFLTVRDNRDGGYEGGVVRLPEGRNVLLADLRAREGRTFSYSAPARPASEPEEAEEPRLMHRPPAPALPDDLDETIPTRRRLRETGPVPVVGADEHPVDASHTGGVPADEVAASAEPTASTPEPEAPPGAVQSDATHAETPDTVHPAPEREPDPAPYVAPPAPVDEPRERAETPWADRVVAQVPFPEPTPVLVAESMPDDPLVQTITYTRDRPKEDEIEARIADPKRRKRNRIILGAVAGVVVLLIGVVWFANQGKTAYAAVCVDERTMARQASDTACEPGADSSPYYRWWYVPAGSRVPAVGDIAQEDQGTVNAPSRKDATVSYGYAESGGVFEKK